MNRKGFTLVELLAVVIVMGLILMITIPNLTKLQKQNETKKYKEYENLLVEYSKVFYNTNNCGNENFACNRNCDGVIDLEDIAGLDDVKRLCEGFVLVEEEYIVDDNSIVVGGNLVFFPYIKCSNKYQTASYNQGLSYRTNSEQNYSDYYSNFCQ